VIADTDFQKMRNGSFVYSFFAIQSGFCTERGRPGRSGFNATTTVIQNMSSHSSFDAGETSTASGKNHPALG
jgi:hypothetical protein